MNTTQIPASEVHPGMQILVAVINRCDPEFGQHRTATITEVTKAGPFLELRGTQDAPDYLGNRTFRAAAYRPTALVEVVA